MVRVISAVMYDMDSISSSFQYVFLRNTGSLSVCGTQNGKEGGREGRSSPFLPFFLSFFLFFSFFQFFLYIRANPFADPQFPFKKLTKNISFSITFYVPSKDTNRLEKRKTFIKIVNVLNHPVGAISEKVSSII